jgi:hypothetical protein
MSVIVPISSALPLKADIGTVKYHQARNLKIRCPIVERLRTIKRAI